MNYLKKNNFYKKNILHQKNYENIEKQLKELWIKINHLKKDLDKFIFLKNIKKNNEILFYKLINKHIEKLLPIIYTPTIGLVCQQFSITSNYQGGIIIPYNKEKIIKKIINNVKEDIKIVVVTDGERVLGLGDQGIGGINIVLSKAMLYSSCAGINPKNVLPIMLDVGTNNKKLINNVFYMGLKNKRITGEKYKNFINQFIRIIKTKWNNVIIHFEDFAKENALYFLEQYKDKLCFFNDDIQGTAIVVLSTLISALNNKNLKEKKIVIFGSGAAGCGIANHLINYMNLEEGITKKEARKNIFMIDQCGLLVDNNKNLLNFQVQLAQNNINILNWSIKKDFISLFDVIKNVKPSILIGTSGKSNLFSKKIISEMNKYCDKPIIMPLSNPCSHIEAKPKNILKWTDGKAIVATGSPFHPIIFKQKVYFIPQCNNFYAFPGLCLGIILSKSNNITEKILITVSKAISNYCLSYKKTLLLPKINNLQEVSKKIALEIIKLSLKKENISNFDELILNKINKNFWLPKYKK